MGGLFQGLLKKSVTISNRTLLRELCQLANAVSAMTNTEPGGFLSLPNLKKFDY
jgi:sugar/nucleoside kinase (ribokinase family)